MQRPGRRVLNTETLDSNQKTERVPKVEKMVEQAKQASNLKLQRVEVKANTDHTLKTVELKRNQNCRNENIGKSTNTVHRQNDKSLIMASESENSKLEQEHEKLGSTMMTIKRNRQSSETNSSCINKQHCWSKTENRKEDRNRVETQNKSATGGKKQVNGLISLEKHQQGSIGAEPKQQNFEPRHQNVRAQERSSAGFGRQLLQRQHSSIFEDQQVEGLRGKQTGEQQQAGGDARKGSTTEGISAKGQPVPSPKVFS